IGGLGGWPWVNEMVALVRRHPKLHLDTSAHRARYLGQRGSGWEMLMQFGNTLIQDKVMVGLSAGLVGQSYETRDATAQTCFDMHASRTRYGPLAAAVRAGGLDDAYAIQDALHGLLAKAG